MNLERLYLDYNATSPLSQSVLNWLKSGDFYFANPSSQHSDGKAARKSINEARSFIYQVFEKNEKDTKLFFHSGATEAFDTFAYSFAELTKRAGKELLICYSSVDHPSVTSLVERPLGTHVNYFALQRDKHLHYRHQANFHSLMAKKGQNPNLVILYHHLWVHNETGQVSDLEELNNLKNIPDLFIHVDAVQAPGKVLDWRNLSAGDIWSFSAHKFGALKGIGFSFFKNSVSFYPLITGGSQQGNLRSGTENALGAKSTALALEDLLKVNIQQTSDNREKLVAYIRDEIKGIGEVIEEKPMASNTIYFYLNSITSDIALALFDINGVEISAGSACASGASKESAVLIHKGFKATAKNGLRLSLPFEVNEDFLNRVKAQLGPIFNKLR